MNEPAITVRDISKAYKISHQLSRNEHPTLKDDLTMMMRKPLALLGASGGVLKEKFWALKDINFEVPKGEVVGLMGRNGSGKSTLFKILSRITQPTEGTAVLNGTHASLLEVGTGFHPELSGRENIYFNGAILGMSKEEIDQKFDDIVAFSEVENFLDTPTKFYSSGMRVRLAFSVAAYLDPDILIIDEVLAVGDVRFKQKSLNRMQEIAEGGKTVFFVSHIISQIERICQRGIVLESGQMVFDGKVEPAIDKYLELNELDAVNANTADGGASGAERADITSDELDVELAKARLLESGEVPGLKIQIVVKNLTGDDYRNLRLGAVLKSQSGSIAMLLGSDLLGQELKISSSQKEQHFEFSVPNLNLTPGGPYHLTIGLRDLHEENHVYARKNNVFSFSVPDYSIGHIKVDPRRVKNMPPVLFNFDLKKLD